MFLSGSFVMSPSLYVLAASLRSKKPPATIVSQEDPTLDPTRRSSKGSLHRTNRLGRLKQLWETATGATFRFVTGRTLGQPGKASATAIVDSERSFAFRFPDPESLQHPPHIGCHPSATNPPVEPPSGAGHFVVNAEPYFVRSTASASEILTNVAIQDMLAIDDPGFYELCCNPRSTSTLASVPESWGSFDFVYPLASSESSDSDLELVNGSPRHSREASPEVSPEVSHENSRQFISSSEVEVTPRNTYPDSPLEDNEEVVVVPVLPYISSSFPHPHILSTIPEENEDEGGHSFQVSLNAIYEGEDETSNAETVRFTSISARARPDTGLIWASEDSFRNRNRNCSPTRKLGFGSEF
ncbi:hypothetical protein BJY52DRAFT_674628 [Lactarius psammicola]|nr:hypothetical protein BJY52DRAFT_674628 [Lactarius psammicola]